MGGFAHCEVKVLVAQSCSALCDPMDCSPPGSSVLGIFQARILEWVAIPLSRGSSWPRSPALQADSLPFELPGKPLHIVADCIFQKWSYRYMSHPTCYDVGYPSIERWNLFSRPLKPFIFLIPVLINRISSVQLLSYVRLFATPWTTALQTSLSITNSWSLLKLMFIMSVMPSNHLINRVQWKKHGTFKPRL